MEPIYLQITLVMEQILKVTNHVVGGEDGVSKPALGESWKSVPHVRLLFSQDCGSNVCNISLLKHPSMVCHLIRKCLYCVVCVS